MNDHGLKTFSPQQHLDEFRRRSLRTLLLLSAFIGTVVVITISFTLEALRDSPWMLATLIALQLVEIGFTIGVKRLPFKLTAGFFIFYALFISYGVMLVTGPLPAPFLSLSVALLSTGLFFGGRAASLTMLISACVFVGMGFLHAYGLTYLLGIEDLDLTQPKNAARLYGVSFCILVIVTLLVTNLLTPSWVASCDTTSQTSTAATGPRHLLSDQ